MIRAQRLSGRKRFAAVRSQGVVARGSILRVRALRTDAEVSRGGIAVRGSTSAVLRNRARRRLRPVLAGALSEHPGLDVLVSATATEVASAPYLELASDLRNALARAQRLTEERGS